jgi:hypothetical protein
MPAQPQQQQENGNFGLVVYAHPQQQQGNGNLGGAAHQQQFVMAAQQQQQQTNGSFGLVANQQQQQVNGNVGFAGFAAHQQQHQSNGNFGLAANQQQQHTNGNFGLAPTPSPQQQQHGFVAAKPLQQQAIVPDQNRHPLHPLAAEISRTLKDILGVTRANRVLLERLAENTIWQKPNKRGNFQRRGNNGPNGGINKGSPGKIKVMPRVVANFDAGAEKANGKDDAGSSNAAQEVEQSGPLQADAKDADGSAKST